MQSDLFVYTWHYMVTLKNWEWPGDEASNPNVVIIRYPVAIYFSVVMRYTCKL